MKIYYVKLEIISIVSIISIISIISNSKNRPTFNLIYIYIYKYFKNNCIRLFNYLHNCSIMWHWECPRSERAERYVWSRVLYIYCFILYIQWKIIINICAKLFSFSHFFFSFYI